MGKIISASGLAALLLLGLATANAAPLPRSPIAGVKMTAFAIASDPPGEIREAPGGGRVLTPTILFTPAVGENIRGPAIVMLSSGPGSNPGYAKDPARWVAERLAARGYTVMSLQSHLDRGYTLFPFKETAHEIGAALTALEARGYEDFILAGSAYGAIAAANYVATNPDKSLDKAGERRVKAVVLLDPATELRHYPGPDLAKSYETVIARARAEFATGNNSYPSDHTIEVGAGSKPQVNRIGTGSFVAPAEAVLDFWSPEAAARNEKLLQSMPVPALVMASKVNRIASLAKLDGLKQNATAPMAIVPFDKELDQDRDTVVASAIKWLVDQGMGPRPRVDEQLVDTVAADGRVLSAMLYTPETIDPAKPALIMTHGRSGDMIQSSTHWMGWRIAQQGYVVLAPSLRISGLTGIQTSTRAEVTQDLRRWMDRFESLGFKRVIATGHSNGGIWISDYKAVTQDPRIIGMIYMAPTVNVSTWPERKADAASYATYKAAKQAVEKGQGSSMVFGIQSATLVYDSLRPEAVSHPERMSQFTLPGLAIIGSEDDLFKRAGVRERLKAGYKGPYEELVYQGGTHGLRESKDRLARDIDRWIRQTFP
jgi:dienelactone hydrolase